MPQCRTAMHLLVLLQKGGAGPVRKLVFLLSAQTIALDVDSRIAFLRGRLAFFRHIKWKYLF